MAMSDKTISQAVELKETLITSINQLIKEFSKETGLMVERIDLVHLADHNGGVVGTIVDIEVRL